MRKFHGMKSFGINGDMIIRECKNDDNCHGRLHFVAFSDQELKWLEKAIQSQKRTWVINEVDVEFEDENSGNYGPNGI